MYMKGCSFIETASNLKKSFVKFALLGTLGTAGAVIAGQNNVSADTMVDATHTQVVAGDTLSQIARAHGTDVATLAQANGISNPNMIMVGQVLSLDGSQANGADNQANVANNQVTTNTVNAQSAVQAPVNNQQSVTPAQQNTSVQNSAVSASAGLSSSEQAAKNWIAQRESGGSYTATNGQYIGKYQLSSSYLNGDYSAANQERVADQYVHDRYGSWQNAQQHWVSQGWY